MAKRLLEDFEYDLQRILREKKDQMETLSKLASANATVNNRMIIQETLQVLHINRVMNINDKESWTTLIVAF